MTWKKMYSSDLERYINTNDPLLGKMIKMNDNLYSDGEIVKLRDARWKNELKDVEKNIFERIYEWIKNKMYKPNIFEEKLFSLHGFIKDYDRCVLDYNYDGFTHVLNFHKYPKSLEIIHFANFSRDVERFKLDYPFVLEKEGILNIIEMFNFNVENKKIDSKVLCRMKNDRFWDGLRFFPAAEFDVDLGRVCSAVDLYMVRML